MSGLPGWWQKMVTLLEERDRYRDALRNISTFEREKFGTWHPTTEAEIAREALKQLEPPD